MRTSLLAPALIFALTAGGGAHAGGFKVIHSFAGGFDGSDPEADLFIDRGGVLYGTTLHGGIGGNNGTLFKIVPGHKEKVVHAFTGGAGDGANPWGGVIADQKGNLYGTTSGGGINGLGVVYKIAPDGSETLVHPFQGICCGIDGSFPIGSLVMDKQGNMYGATQNGGSFADLGSVFEIKADGTESIVHGFAGGSDGAIPGGGLTRDKSGSLYGITDDGGSSGDFGVLYQIASSGGAETVLHSFGGTSSDGKYPWGHPILDKAENLLGITLAGGGPGLGIVYVVTPAGIETIVHTFTGSDGAEPASSLIEDKKGNLYGVTDQGGASNLGTVFELKGDGEYKILHSFDGTDGTGPVGGLAADADGNLYGTTHLGGRNNMGVVFEITSKKKHA